MSAAELRDAARLTRERAQAVPRSWRLAGSQVVADGTDPLPGTDVIATCMVPDRAAYVASMHPGVALAVADWLDERAAEYDDLEPAAAAFVAGDAGGDADPAIRVARACLGETP